MQDSMIIDLYFERNEQAIEETKVKFGRYLCAVAKNLLRDIRDSEEAVSDAYMRAWNSMPPHRPKVLSAFLAKLTRSSAVDILRKNSAQKRSDRYSVSLSELEETLSGGCVESEIDVRMLGEEINSYIGGLPKEQRQVFVMRYFYLDSISDIAQSLGRSQAYVKSLLFRMRQRLKEHLQKGDYI